MRFKSINGLEDLKSTLIRSVKANHIAHAQMFSGKEGGAGLAMAMAYISYIICENPGVDDSCGYCAACLKNDKFIHPDVQFVYPVSTTKKVTKEPISQLFLADWRIFLAENIYGDLNDWSLAFGAENKQCNISKEESRNIIKNLALKPFEAQFKIMLIWLPEAMHPSAANAILKVLEEPSGQTIFLLVSQNSDKIIQTILSRTQKINVRAFSDSELAEILKEKYNVDDKRAKDIAVLAEGNVSKDLKYHSEAEDDNHSFFREWMRFCYTVNVTELVGYADKYQSLSKESQKIVLFYGVHIFRQCLIWNNGLQSLTTLQGEEQDFVKKFSVFFDENKIGIVQEQFDNSYYYLERNASPKMIFLDLSLYMSGILRS